jgi:hypothetical protein
LGDDFKEPEFCDRDKGELGEALGAGIDKLAAPVGLLEAGGVEKVLALRAEND